MSIQPVNKAVEHLINPTAVLERGEKRRRKKVGEKEEEKRKKDSMLILLVGEGGGGGRQGHSHTQLEGLPEFSGCIK